MRLHRKRPVDHADWATPCRPTSNSALPDVVRTAERIVYVEKWRWYEEQAAARLRGTRSVRWTRLFPSSPVIVVVAVDGAVIGRVRRSGTRWMVVPSGCARPIASRRTRRGAIAHLARRVGAGY
jgi:hypothetical protein